MSRAKKTSRAAADSPKSHSSEDLSVEPLPEIQFDDEIPIHISSSSDQADSLIRVRVVNKAETGDVSVELSKDADLFFLYEATYSESTFQELKKAQDLTIEFADFPPLLADCLGQVVDKGVGGFVLDLAMGQGEAVLHIQQKLKFKVIDVFSLTFTAASDDTVRDQIQAKYDALRDELMVVKGDLSDIYAMLKIKNPSVLRQVRTTRK
jgi:hypothetical protein